jgi:hypothetical protein
MDAVRTMDAVKITEVESEPEHMRLRIIYKSGRSMDITVKSFNGSTDSAGALTAISFEVIPQHLLHDDPGYPVFIGITNIESIWRLR